MPQIRRFERVGLIAKAQDTRVAETLATVIAYLQRRACRVLLDESCAGIIDSSEQRLWPRAALGTEAELVIVIGGDGTLLNAVRTLNAHEVPLLGINLGRLGFLVDVSREAVQQHLDAILEGDYVAEERLMLEAEIVQDGKATVACSALNDVVVHKWDIARMIELDTHIDGRFVHTHRSDGLIIATPTGSTAYALSGGGPILSPTLDAMVLVPICPHTLSNRPIVIHADSIIELMIRGAREPEAQITCDGQVKLALTAGDSVRVRRHARKARLLHPAGHDHSEILRKKLGWGGGL